MIGVPAAEPRRRLVALDVLRLLAVMLVLGRHMPIAPDTWSAPVREAFRAWQRGGWVGVDLFFVLSGFLVSGLLFNEYQRRGRFSAVRFYVRRGWKIYPPFFLLLAVSVAVSVWYGSAPDSTTLISESFFLQSYMPGLWPHTWSLAVEEHFYFLLPLVLLLVLRQNREREDPFRSILPLGALIAVVVLGLRLYNWHNRPVYSDLTHLFATHLRLDSLFFGVVISYVYHFHRVRFVESTAQWRALLVAGGILLLMPVFLFTLESTPLLYVAGLTIIYIGCGMLLMGALACEKEASRFLGRIGTCGSYSYSIYLWHLPVMLWGVPLVQRAMGRRLTFAEGAASYIAGSLCVGVVMAKLVEVPALALRDRWFPSRGSARGIANTPTLPQVAIP